MKKLLIVLLALTLLLCACGKAETPETTAEPTTEATTEATTEPTTEPPILYRHPLTGEPLDAPFSGFVTTAVINNIKDCLPQFGISKADLYYEVETEGGITRCLAVYTNLEGVGSIGPVRSVRTFFNNITASYGGTVIHCGGSVNGLKGWYSDTSSLSNWQHIDQRFNGGYFFRDSERSRQGYAYEHTLFTTGDSLIKALDAKDYDKVKELDFGLTFEDDVILAGEKADKIVVTFKGDKTTTMTYNKALDEYEMSQYGGLTVDATTGKTMTFANVLVLYTSQWKIHDGYYSRSYYDLIGEGEGYMAISGKIVPITWQRDSVEKPFAYFLSDGTPVTLSQGTSYIAIASETSDPISYE